MRTSISPVLSSKEEYETIAPGESGSCGGLTQKPTLEREGLKSPTKQGVRLPTTRPIIA
jgi:hypothetical protein